jgi:hypothetical protein
MMKTSELTGAALDWAVTKCETGQPLDTRGAFLVAFKYSTDWAQGGPIIEREKIEVTYQSDVEWQAGQYPTIDDLHCGPTPLVAAMRCFVAAKLGDDIEVPPELK